MSKPKTMNKDELLEWLSIWYETSLLEASRETQAYNQIKEIVQNQSEQELK